MNNLFVKSTVLIVLVFVINSFLYYSFGNIYSSHLFNVENFKSQYFNGIYQYRFLSSQLLLWIYDFLNSVFPSGIPLKAPLVDKEANINFFTSFYILNTGFLILSALMMLFITETKNFIGTALEKFLIILLALLPTFISQFVMVPYDCSSYFLMLLFFYLLIHFINNKNKGLFWGLVAILVVSTMNRESSALSISLAATLLFSKYGFTKSSVRPVGILTLAFVLVYLMLRYVFGTFTTNDGNLLEANFTHPNAILGMVFSLVFFFISLMVCKGSKQIKWILTFHLLALPYILMCFYSGYLYEIRLYIPIFLSSIFLSRLELENDWYS